MPLTDAKLRAAQAGAKPYKLSDGRGLYLLITPAGGRYWRFRWERGGKERTLSLGDYPAMGLAAARDARDSARLTLRQGGEPSAVRPDVTFQAAALRWHTRHKARWSERHAADVLASMRRDLFPRLGAMPMGAIDVPTMLAALRVVEDRGAVETAARLAQRASMVFLFGIGEGIAVSDPATVAKAALGVPVRGRQPAIVRLPNLRRMLDDVAQTPAHPLTHLAMRVLALTAVRPGSIAGAMWGEFEGMDGPEPIWRIPAARMKGTPGRKREHIVPLQRGAVEALAAARPFSGKGELVFPSVRRATQPMSENTLNVLLNRAGYRDRHVPHGFRASFSTIMNERMPHNREVIDLMLAHAPQNAVESAYNRAEHAERRREIADAWGELLLEGAPSAKALTLGPRR